MAQTQSTALGLQEEQVHQSFVEEKQEVEEVCEGELASEVCEEAQGY